MGAGGHCAPFPHESAETVCPLIKVSTCPMFGLANYSFAALPDLAILRLVLGIFCHNLLLQAEFLLLCSGWPGCPDSVLLRACFSDCLGRTACLLNIDGT